MGKGNNAKFTLCRLQIAEAPEIFRLIEENRSYLGKWLPWVDSCQRINDSEEFIERCLESESKKESLTAVIKISGEIVGLISFRNFDWIKGESILGYWIGQKFQGKGIITGSCALMIQYAFEELDLNYVKIRCLEKNIKSQAIPERLFFTKEKVILGEEITCLGKTESVNMIYYGMNIERWQETDKFSFVTGDISSKFSQFPPPIENPKMIRSR